MDYSTEQTPIQKIDIMDNVLDVLHQWWVILLWGIAVSLVTFVYCNLTYQPKYTATTTFVVTNKSINSNIYSDMTSAQEMASKFSNILESNTLKRTVAADLGVKNIYATTAVTQVDETNLLEVSVTANTAVEAFKILNSMMENYDSVSNYVLKDVILEVIQPATVPTAPSNPIRQERTIILSFLIAIAISSAMILVLSYCRDTLKNADQFEEKIDADCLGTIYHEKKGKSLSMLITNPLRSFRFTESSRMTATKIENQLKKRGQKVLLVTSVAENEGKSTVAANLAIALSQIGKKVILIDCDFRNPSQYKIFNVQHEFQSLTEAMSTKQAAEGLIQRDEKSGLYMVLSRSAYSTKEAISDNQILIGTILGAKNWADYVILDCAPMAMVSDTEDLARLADASVVVVRRDIVLSKDINDAIDALENTHGKVLGCVLNDARPEWNTSSSRSGYGGYYGNRTHRTK